MKRVELTNWIFKIASFVAAISMLLIIVGILISLLVESLPAIRHYGFFKFLTTADWNYGKEVFGALRPLTGTVISTFLALLVAAPIAIGTAIFLTSICPNKLRGGIGAAIELLAAIPSIIYGMWGLFVLAPFLEAELQPLFARTLGQLPVVGSFFASPPTGGVNLFSASMVLSVMVIPFIASIARDALDQTPAMLRESSYALGATKWETIWRVEMAYAKSAISGGIILAMGRALGETMAVAYVIGNRHASLSSIFSPYTTITSVMANEFNEASGIQLSSLFTLALVLFIANFIVILIGKRIIRRK
jgi:phosphate transport system permease protein